MTSKRFLSDYCLMLLGLLSGCSSAFWASDDEATFENGNLAGAQADPMGGSAGSTPSESVTGASGATGGDRSMPVEMAGAPAVGGAGGAEPECIPSGVETCNGADDDCSGTLDDGCPGGIGTTFEQDLKALGDSAGGAEFTEDCKDGEVLGGVEVAMGAFLSQVRGLCRKLELELNPDAPLGYKIRAKDADPLLAHPQQSTDTVTTLSCPDDDVLVGLRISQQYVSLLDGKQAAVIPRVWLSCAKLVLIEHDGAYGVEWRGLKELAPTSGSIANGTAWFASAEAPQGLVATRLLGATGAWVDRVGFGVSRIQVEVK